MLVQSDRWTREVTRALAFLAACAVGILAIGNHLGENPDPALARARERPRPPLAIQENRKPIKEDEKQAATVREQPRPFLGVPEDRDTETMTAVHLEDYKWYLCLRKAGLIVKEDTRGCFILFAMEKTTRSAQPPVVGERCALMGETKVIHRYKALVPSIADQ
jgi:hypothetical protein